MPFWQLENTDEPLIDLRQVGPNAFQLLTGFRYGEADGDAGPHIVPAHDPDAPPTPGNRTDLASVPTYLWWFIASHGKQTRPALMHDHLVGEIDRVEADRLFRVALEEVGVSPVRRWLMWTAVSLATMKERSPGTLGAFIAHLAVALTTALAWLGGWDLPVVGAIAWWVPAALLVVGALWGHRWWWSAFGILLLAPATLLVWVTTWIVWGLDLVGWALARMGGTPTPLPTPLPYREQSREY